MAGWIYVMSNPSFERGIVKIGKSERDPSLHRKKELETSGVPSAFVVEYQVLVQDEGATERFLHDKFDELRVEFDANRNARNREFFRVSKAKVIEALKAEASVEILFEPQLSSFDAPDDAIKQRRTKSAISSRPFDWRREPTVASWLQTTRAKCARAAARIHTSLVAAGGNAYDVALYVKNGEVKPEDCLSQEDYYLYLLNRRNDEVVALMWQFKDLDVEQRIAEVRRTNSPERLAQLRGKQN